MIRHPPSRIDLLPSEVAYWLQERIEARQDARRKPKDVRGYNESPNPPYLSTMQGRYRVSRFNTNIHSSEASICEDLEVLRIGPRMVESKTSSYSPGDKYRTGEDLPEPSTSSRGHLIDCCERSTSQQFCNMRFSHKHGSERYCLQNGCRGDTCTVISDPQATNHYQLSDSPTKKMIFSNSYTNGPSSGEDQAQEDNSSLSDVVASGSCRLPNQSSPLTACSAPESPSVRIAPAGSANPEYCISAEVFQNLHAVISIAQRVCSVDGRPSQEYNERSSERSIVSSGERQNLTLVLDEIALALNSELDNCQAKDIVSAICSWKTPDVAAPPDYDSQQEYDAPVSVGLGKRFATNVTSNDVENRFEHALTTESCSSSHSLTTPRISVYDDSLPPHIQPQTPADISRTPRFRRGHWSTDHTFPSRDEATLSSRRQVPHPYVTTHVPGPSLPGTAFVPDQSFTGSPLRSRSSAQASTAFPENDHIAIVQELEDDRRTWARRRRSGSLDVTPPREGRFEHHFSS